MPDDETDDVDEATEVTDCEDSTVETDGEDSTVERAGSFEALVRRRFEGGADESVEIEAEIEAGADESVEIEAETEAGADESVEIEAEIEAGADETSVEIEAETDDEVTLVRPSFEATGTSSLDEAKRAPTRTHSICCRNNAMYSSYRAGL